MKPRVINGSNFQDHRGILNYNNLFNAFEVKRLYTIQNTMNSPIRRWQGHKVEQRWFAAIMGEFRIELIKVDNWELPSKTLKKEIFEISDRQLDILHIPEGYVTSIQDLKEKSILLVMADYQLNEIDDNYKFDSNYFL